MSRNEVEVFGICTVAVFIGSVSPGPAEAAPALKDPNGETSQSRKLKLLRVQALRTQLQGGFERVKIGKDSVVDYLQTIRDLYEAEVSLADSREAKLAVMQKACQMLFVWDEQIAQLQQAGLATFESVRRTRAARASAELELEKLKSP